MARPRGCSSCLLFLCLWQLCPGLWQVVWVASRPETGRALSSPPASRSGPFLTLHRVQQAQGELPETLASGHWLIPAEVYWKTTAMWNTEDKLGEQGAKWELFWGGGLAATEQTRSSLLERDGSCYHPGHRNGRARGRAGASSLHL